MDFQWLRWSQLRKLPLLLPIRSISTRMVAIRWRVQQEWPCWKYAFAHQCDLIHVSRRLVSFQVIEREELQKNALEVGTYFMKSLEQLRRTSNFVGDVRGQGLMIGVELVESQESRKPLRAEYFSRVFNDTKDRGVLFGGGGLNGNVSLKFMQKYSIPQCFRLIHSYRSFASNRRCVSRRPMSIWRSMCWRNHSNWSRTDFKSKYNLSINQFNNAFIS